MLISSSRLSGRKMWSSLSQIHLDMDDIMAWHFDARGLFSVRSAYKVHRENIWLDSGRSASTSTGNGGSEDLVWKKLWKLACPGKIKHFLWRLGHNSLALRTNLLRRGLELDTRCVVCSRVDENGRHLFCQCKHVKRLWQELNLEHVRSRLDVSRCGSSKKKTAWWW